MQSAPEFILQAKEFVQSGLAIEPILVKGQGEMTRLILKEDQLLLPCSSHRFVKQLCQSLFLDLKSLQHAVQEKVNKKQLVPIPISFQTVLIPLRCLNEENIKTQGFLWVIHRHLLKVKPIPKLPNCSYLVLTNGSQLQVPYSPQFIQQQLRNSWLIEYLFQQAHLTFPLEDRPPLFGQAWNSQAELHLQLLHIADAIRKYSS